MIRKALSVAILISVVSMAAAAQMKESQVAPGFTIVDLSGKRITLSGFKGKVVLLNFWATWCAPCQSEIPRFTRFQTEFSGKGFQVIGISMDDSAGPVQAFQRKHSVNYPIAMGTTKLAEKYGGVLGLPITFLIGRDGRIAKRYEGAVDLEAMEREIRGLLAEQ